uniref:Uncharacterized protein n=1 Tax=Macaca fascicularis TaxID=9541 RepID=A0A7N9D6T5_MACFA
IGLFTHSLQVWLPFCSCSRDSKMRRQRMDEGQRILPNGVSFQCNIRTDTQKNRCMFSSIYHFSQCSQGSGLKLFSASWEARKDSSLQCSSVYKAQYEPQGHSKNLNDKSKTLSKRKRQPKEKINKIDRPLRYNNKKNRTLEIARQKRSENLATKAINHVNSKGAMR